MHSLAALAVLPLPVESHCSPELPLLVSILRGDEDIFDMFLPPGVARSAGQALCDLRSIWGQHGRRPFPGSNGPQPSADEVALLTLMTALTQAHAPRAIAVLDWLLHPAGHAPALRHAHRMARALALLERPPLAFTTHH